MHRKIRLSIIAAAAIVPAAFMAFGALAAGGNMVTNGTFDSNVNGWAPFAGFPTSTISWSAGAALVTNTSALDTGTLGAATQCVDTIMPQQTYIFSGSAYVPGGQQRDGDADTRVFFYSGPGCSGAVLGSPFGANVGNVASQLDKWVPFSSAIDSPAGANSARVMIMAGKDKAIGLQKKTDPFTVEFDDISFSLKLTPIPTPTPPIVVVTTTPVATVTPPPTVTATPSSTPSPTATPSATATPTNTPAGTGTTTPDDVTPGTSGEGSTGQSQGEAGSGEPVKALGSIANVKVDAPTAEAPLPPSTGSGNQHVSQQAGLIDWPVFAMLVVALVALAGLIVAIGTTLSRRNAEDEF